MSRTSADDLLRAAEWLNAYEAEDGHGERDPREGPYTGTDETAATTEPTGALVDAIIALTHRIHVGEGRGKSRRPMTVAEVDALRAERDALRAEVVRRAEVSTGR